MRPGLRLTSSSTIAEPGTIVAATTKNAADDGSPGTASSNASGAPARTRSVRSSTALDRRAERAEHPLGVVAARRRLDDLGLAVGLQPGEHERGLHLAARDRELVAHAVQRAAADRQRRELAVGAPSSVRAHRPQRLDDPPHRPARERRRRRSGPTGTAGRRRGRTSMRIVVPELPQSMTVSGSRSPSTPAPVDRRPRVGARRRTRTPSCSSAPAVLRDVLAVGQVRDPARAVGERGEQQRAVRDALAAGQPQAAAQRPAALDDELGGRRHGSALQATW